MINSVLRYTSVVDSSPGAVVARDFVMVAIESYAGELKKALKYDKGKQVRLRVSVLSLPLLLHRLTGYGLMFASFLVTCDMLFGKPIHCLHNAVMPSVGLEAFLNTYCWFNATYTVDMGQDLVYAHPGVAPSLHGDPKSSKFVFYQWVALFLFLQGILIGLPVKIWAEMGAKRLKELMITMPERHVVPVKLNASAKKDDEAEEADISEESKCREEERVQCLVVEPLVRSFIRDAPYAFSYTASYIMTEFICVLNVLTQVWLLNVFLDHKFFDFVLQFVSEGSGDDLVLFPRVTKCAFPFFSAGGSVQVADALCILPMNIINEKIYLVLALWIALLVIISVVHLICLLSVGLSTFVRRQVLKWLVIKSNRGDNAFLADQLSFSSWFLFTHLTSMLSARAERNVFVTLLSQKLDRKKRRYGVFREPQINSVIVSQQHERESLRLRNTSEAPEWMHQRNMRKTPV